MRDARGIGPFGYVGPPEIQARAAGAEGGVRIDSVARLAAWVAANHPDVDTDGAITLTYVVLPSGLHVAHRRSEHVACARGAAVMAAGEIRFVHQRRWAVESVSNLSTGYCPDVRCWPAVQAALEAAGFDTPDRFDPAIEFRRCSACGQRNLVKDGDLTCAVCRAELPAAWNFGE